MKPIIAILFAALLCGCATTQNEDGTTTTRFDPEAAGKVLDSGMKVYDRYNQTRYIVGYRADGSPIYAAQ